MDKPIQDLESFQLESLLSERDQEFQALLEWWEWWEDQIIRSFSAPRSLMPNFKDQIIRSFSVPKSLGNSKKSTGCDR